MLQLLTALLFALAPAAPPTATELAFHATPGQAQDVALADGLAFVADGTAGLRILDVSRPDARARSAPSIRRASPGGSP